MFPWVHARLQSLHRFDLVGEHAREELARLRHKIRNDNLLLLAQAERALDVLLASGITPIALKGLDALHRFYDGFDQRQLNDVDLLVPPAQRDLALEVLARAGWMLPPEKERRHWLRRSYQMPMRSPGPVEVRFEIHWSLAQARRYTVDVASVFERAVPAEIAGRPILRLQDEDAVAHLLLHHFQHYFGRRIKWNLELAWFLGRQDLDGRAVARRIEEWGGTAAVGLVLLHQRKLFPRSVSEEVLRLLPASPWRLALTWPLRSGHPLELFRWTERRWVQLALAGACLERPSYLVHWVSSNRAASR